MNVAEGKNGSLQDLLIWQLAQTSPPASVLLKLLINLFAWRKSTIRRWGCPSRWCQILWVVIWHRLEKKACGTADCRAQRSLLLGPAAITALVVLSLIRNPSDENSNVHGLSVVNWLTDYQFFFDVRNNKHVFLFKLLIANPHVCRSNMGNIKRSPIAYNYFFTAMTIWKRVRLIGVWSHMSRGWYVWLNLCRQRIAVWVGLRQIWQNSSYSEECLDGALGAKNPPIGRWELSSQGPTRWLAWVKPLPLGEKDGKPWLPLEVPALCMDWRIPGDTLLDGLEDEGLLPPLDLECWPTKATTLWLTSGSLFNIFIVSWLLIRKRGKFRIRWRGWFEHSSDKGFVPVAKSL